MNQFKEAELAKIRHEERDKLSAEMRNYRKDLEQTYEKRYEALKQREQTIDEMLKQKKAVEEREIYMQRQNLLGNIILIFSN
jgi:hypothetical protein